VRTSDGYRFGPQFKILSDAHRQVGEFLEQIPSGNWFIQLRLGGESVPITESTKKKCIHAAEVVKAEYRTEKRAKTANGEEITLRQAMDTRSNALSPFTIRGYGIIRDNRFKVVADKQLKTSPIGVPERVAMQIGGWADSGTMHGIYTYLNQKDIAKYEIEMTKFFKNANENVNG